MKLQTLGEGDPILITRKPYKIIKAVGSKEADNLLKEWLVKNRNPNPSLDEKLFLAQECGVELKKVKLELIYS